MSSSLFENVDGGGKTAEARCDNLRNLVTITIFFTAKAANPQLERKLEEQASWVDTVHKAPLSSRRGIIGGKGGSPESRAI